MASSATWMQRWSLASYSLQGQLLSGAKTIRVKGLKSPLLCLEGGGGETENMSVCREVRATWGYLGSKKEGGVDWRRKTCEPNADTVRVIDQTETVNRVCVWGGGLYAVGERIAMTVCIGRRHTCTTLDIK